MAQKVCIWPCISLSPYFRIQWGYRDDPDPIVLACHPWRASLITVQEASQSLLHSDGYIYLNWYFQKSGQSPYSWSICFTTRLLESQAGSLAVDQGQIHPEDQQGGGWRCWSLLLPTNSTKSSHSGTALDTNLLPLGGAAVHGCW